MTDVLPNVTDAEGPAEDGPSAPNIVRVNGHTITLHPKVTIPLGVAALSVIKQGGGQAAMEGGLSEVYLRFGIESWDFDEPVTPENIDRLLPFADGGLEVAEAADRLYSGDVFRPLVARMAKLSPPSRTAPPTSAPTAGGSTPRTPSRRSSRTTSTDGSTSEATAP